MSNSIIYTSIFGGYDNVNPQKVNGWDWKCFSEENSLPIYQDNTRNAKRFKVLPHRYLKDYEYSIFIDGNMEVREDNLNELIDKYLNDANVAFFSHNNNGLDSRNCAYEEARTIFQLGEKNMNATPERGVLNYKDNPFIIQNQMETYRILRYPANHGLITGMVILRRHNEADCIETMEDWWTEIKYGSRRDQLSFNYVAWKNNLKFNYIEGDSRDNKYFKRDTNPHIGKK